MCVEIGNSGWQPSLITEFQPIHHEAALLNLRKVITKARPFITAELCTSCCLGESWLQQQRCSHVTSPPICISFISRPRLPCRVVKQGWMEIWAWGGESSLKMVQSCCCWPWWWAKTDLDLLTWCHLLFCPEGICILGAGRSYVLPPLLLGDRAAELHWRLENPPHSHFQVSLYWMQFGWWGGFWKPASFQRTESFSVWKTS